MDQTNLSCKQVRQYIDDLSQHQLHEETKSPLIDKHISQCDTCREYFNRAKTLSDQLDKWSVPAPKRNITTAVMAQIAQLEHDKKIEQVSLLNRLPHFFTHRLKVPVSAAAAVIIILSISVILNIKSFNANLNSSKELMTKLPPVYTQPQVIEITSSGKEQMCFFGINTKSATTPLVIILGAPGIVPIETTPKFVTNNSQNQSL
ncbi:MAG: hypothetical protein ACYSWP_09235 [Planctomycetota bacterium]|jgi:hypothetical protein